MDIAKLQGVIPDLIYNQVQEVLDKFGIDNEQKMAHFLGQCDHESAGFKALVENLNYSGQALFSLFRKYFATQELANGFARQPERIANHIYASRMGNGNEASGDGWRYRGKGCIQLTGKSNHIAFFTAMGLPPTTDPGVVATEYPLLSAAWFWNGHKLNATADAGMDDVTITKVTKVINGGTIGLDDRIAKTRKYYALLTS